jgi:hypothetical protein
MALEIAKLLLEHADTLIERQEAVEKALALGMPLAEIEAYLDWLDSFRCSDKSQRERSPKPHHRDEPP